MMTGVNSRMFAVGGKCLRTSRVSDVRENLMLADLAVSFVLTPDWQGPGIVTRNEELVVSI